MWGGARVKNNVGDYLSTRLTLDATTQEIARVAVSQTPAGPICQFKQMVGDDWVATDPSTMGGIVCRTQVALPASSEARSAEYSIAMFDARTGVPQNSSQMVVVPFAGNSHSDSQLKAFAIMTSGRAPSNKPLQPDWLRRRLSGITLGDYHAIRRSLMGAIER